MHRIDTPTAQVDKFGLGKNGFTRGNPQTGTPATELDDDYFDMLQEELATVVESTGVALDKAKHNQLLTALKNLLLSRSNPFADIKADGNAAIATALANLGLGAAAKKDVGTGTGQLPSMSSFTTNYDGGSAYQINWPSTVTGKNGSSLQLQSALVNLSPGYQVVTLPFVVPTQAVFCDISIDAGSANPGAAIGAGLSDFNKIRLVNFGSTGTTVRYYCWCV